MINFNFQITNPWSDRFDLLRYWRKGITKNKVVDLHIYRGNTFVELEFRLNLFKTDHAGLILTLGLFGWIMYFSVYDVRHWDYENKRWIENEESNS